MAFNIQTRASVTLAILGVTLAACGSGSSGSDISLKNPDFFVAKTVDGTISGSYNPTGYGDAKVQTLLAYLCANNRLASYGEQVTDNGLVAFSATCNGATKYSRISTEFERIEAQGIVIENTYFDGSGNAKYERLNVS